MNAATADWSAAQAMSASARLLALGAAGLFAYGALDWTLARPWFALGKLDVTTPVAHVTEAQIELVAERHARGTFFTVDLDAFRAGLEKLPWVAGARVERRWPDTLEVRLVEHQPFARWNDDALVSDAGRVFGAALDTPLPRLAGPAGSAPEVVAAYARFQKLLAPASLAPAALTLSPRRAWTLTLQDGLRIELGRAEPERRLARFAALYPKLFPAGTATPRAVDLRYPDGFALRLAAGQKLAHPDAALAEAVPTESALAHPAQAVPLARPASHAAGAPPLSATSPTPATPAPAPSTP